MIVSHKYKFIYLRSQKTASTSLDVFFSAYCDDNDIVTHMPESVPDWHKATRLLNCHIPANEVRDVVGASVFNEYYKITSIRNPVDKLLSCYFWWMENQQNAPPHCRPSDFDSFSSWIMSYGFNHRMAIFHEPYYKINGKIIVDDYIRYETLEEDLMRICGILGMEYDGKYLSHYKKSKRKDVDITDKAMDKIRKQFKTELIDLDYDNSNKLHNSLCDSRPSL